MRHTDFHWQSDYENGFLWLDLMGSAIRKIITEFVELSRVVELRNAMFDLDFGLEKLRLKTGSWYHQWLHPYFNLIYGNIADARRSE